MKKRIVSTTAICFMLMISFVLSSYGSVKASPNSITPRAVACYRCPDGKMFRVSRQTQQVMQAPCIHGWGGERDELIITYLAVYEECDTCDWGGLVSGVETSREYVWRKGKEGYENAC